MTTILQTNERQIAVLNAQEHTLRVQRHLVITSIRKWSDEQKSQN